MFKLLLLCYLWALATALPSWDISRNHVTADENNIRRQVTRTWRVRGPAIAGFPNNTAANAYINGLMKTFMSKTAVTQAQVSIAKGGTQLFNRAYTLDDPSRTTTEVDDVFLLASVSKMYCVAAVQMFLNSKTSVVKPGLKVYRQLGYVTAKDARAFDITVQHLLEHQGGDDRAISGDPAYKMRAIANQMSGGTRPATERDIIEYKLLREKLDYQPGTRPAGGTYSNYGFILLSYLVQNVSSSSSYYKYLTEKILKPNNLDVRQWLTDPKHHVKDSVRQIDSGFGLSALKPRDNTLVEAIYGGDGMFKDSNMGGAALAASAATLTRTAAKYPVWGWKNGRSSGYIREGDTAGARTRVESRLDGLDFAIVVNSREFANEHFQNLVNAIKKYLDAEKPTL